MLPSVGGGRAAVQAITSSAQAAIAASPPTGVRYRAEVRLRTRGSCPSRASAISTREAASVNAMQTENRSSTTVTLTIQPNASPT